MKFKSKCLSLALLSLLVATSAHAKPTSYTFDAQAIGTSVTKTGGGLATIFLNASYFPAKGHSKASIKFVGSSGSVGTVQVTFKDKFIQYGVTNGAVDYTKVLGTAVNGEFTFTIVNATRIAKPNGIIGYTGGAASSTGKAKFTNVTDVTGDGKPDTIEYSFETKYMNWFPYLTHATYLSELANLGNANFFLWDSVKLAGTVAKAWYGSVGVIKVNGAASTLFSMAAGDLHFNNGTKIKKYDEDDCEDDSDYDDSDDDDSEDEDDSDDEEDDDSYKGWRKKK